MSQRFFVDTSVTGESCRLVGAEAQHLIRVMRARVGDEVILFDGSGAEFTGRINKIGKDSTELTIIAQHAPEREHRFAVTLAVALPKGDRQKVLVEKLVELGATRLIPLITERGVAQPVEAARERLVRGVIEASKQCGRNRLLEIAEPISVSQLARACNSAIKVVAHPNGHPLRSLQTDSDLAAAVGPEGGFTDDEVAALEEGGWQRVSLGPRILRIETAAIAIAAWITLS